MNYSFNIVHFNLNFKKEWNFNSHGPISRKRDNIFTTQTRDQPQLTIAVLKQYLVCNNWHQGLHFSMEEQATTADSHSRSYCINIHYYKDLLKYIWILALYQ